MLVLDLGAFFEHEDEHEHEDDGFLTSRPEVAIHQERREICGECGAVYNLLNPFS